jgi:cytochrome c oxidase subunit 4
VDLSVSFTLSGGLIMDDNHKHSHHYIIPTKTALTIGGALLFLTAVTVGMSYVDLGSLNFLFAMIVATIKAFLVALFFMNLLHDHRENGVIFATAFLFLAIFFVLTSTDVFFRGDVYVKGPLVAAETKSKFVKPWISTPELVAHGHDLFMVNCVSCHGDHGKGDGIAAAALNPHPRNFTSSEGWVNGRKPSQVFKTLKEGVAGSAMASFATLSSDDRWSLDAYVLSLGPKPPTDSTDDLAKIGINPNAVGGGEVVEKTVPVEFAMKMLAQMPTTEIQSAMASGSLPSQNTPGAQLYGQYCLSCHGDHGQGGIRVKALAVAPSPAYVETEPFRAANDAVSNEASFEKLLINGLPGNLMPSFGQLSGAELRELHGYVHSLAH